MEPLIVSAEPVAAEAADKVPCGICRRQFSKYTCPTCDVAYCSLTCFRSESHSQCSETFYRKEVETGIKCEPSKSAEERLKMMELLKRLEHQSQGDETNLLEIEDEDASEDAEAGLAQRLSGMDINSLSPDDLWSILTPEEREKFMKALDNPSSELAQQILASEELDSEILEPWWEAPFIDDATGTPSAKRYGAKPEAMLIPSMIPKVPAIGFLLYNICALCITYAYTIRHLATSPLSSMEADDPDFQEARRIISQLSPFLTDRKSKVLHSSLSGAVTDVWSRFESGKVDDKLVSLLLHDTAQLLRPQLVSVVSPPAPPGQEITRSKQASHPTFLMLSDLSKLFQPVVQHEQPSEAVAPRQNHITMKISFYIAHIASIPSVILSDLSGEVLARSRVVDQEAILSPSNSQPYVSGSLTGGLDSAESELERNGKMPMIEELF